MDEPQPGPRRGVVPLQVGTAPLEQRARDAASDVGAAGGRTGLTVATVVPAGAVVGLDDSDLVLGLLDELVAARPSLVGTAALLTLDRLVATPAARAGRLTVRMFGGLHHAPAGSFTGSRNARAVTATGCDVALVGGRAVGADVWVPTDVRGGRLALLLAARRAYVVLAAENGVDEHDRAAADIRRSWSRLASLTAFDGVLEVHRAVAPGRAVA